MTRVAAVVAPAKINLFLRILHRRGDGYRELETLLQAVSLYDRVEVEIGAQPTPEAVNPAGQTNEGGLTTLEVVGADVGPERENLAYRAVEAFRKESGLGEPVSVRLEKHIPAGAGLGGGSSDAAAVLRCLQALTGQVTGERLQQVALELGSDVPFFVAGDPLALGRGRGEILTPVAALPETHLVLALPPVHVSTAAAYGALAGLRAAELGDPDGEPHGGARRLELAGALGHEKLAALLENDFEVIIAGEHAEVAASLDGLRAEGALGALLSGSGASSFGLFDGEDDARQAAARLEERLGWPFVPVKTLQEPPVVEVR